MIDGADELAPILRRLFPLMTGNEASIVSRYLSRADASKPNAAPQEACLPRASDHASAPVVAAPPVQSAGDPGCIVNSLLSRMCERGTKSCVVEHGQSAGELSREQIEDIRARLHMPMSLSHPEVTWLCDMALRSIKD